MKKRTKLKVVVHISTWMLIDVDYCPTLGIEDGPYYFVPAERCDSDGSWCTVDKIEDSEWWPLIKKGREESVEFDGRTGEPITDYDDLPYHRQWFMFNRMPIDRDEARAAVMESFRETK